VIPGTFAFVVFCKIDQVYELVPLETVNALLVARVPYEVVMFPPPPTVGVALTTILLEEEVDAAYGELP